MTRITGGLRITGGFNITNPNSTPVPSIFTPTGTPTSLFSASSNSFEMGAWSSGDNTTVPDISGNNRSMGLNDATYSGNVNYYHFLNNSAQANNWDWPADNTDYLAIMGWFAFPNFNRGDMSLVSRNEGGSGWALRIFGNGNGINLVKYNDVDQTYTLPSTLTTNTWHFIGITQQFGSIELIVDGNAYSYTGSSNPFASSGGPVRLQYDPYNGGNQNNEMYMREVKVVWDNVTGLDLISIWNAQKANYGY